MLRVARKLDWVVLVCASEGCVQGVVQMDADVQG